MDLPLLAIIVIAALWLGYRFYGAYVARQVELDPKLVTPARRLQDGMDHVPTRPVYLLPQHFSAIAAAGPIAGPILACQQFGWLPCILWITAGVIFIGAVHDFSTLVASVRHGARSIAEIVRMNLGRGAWLAIMGFIWLALIYIIVAFTDVTASTFVSQDADMRGLAFSFNPGGAVAAASILYLLLSVVMGLAGRFLRPPLWLQTILFVPATLGLVWVGTKLSTLLLLDARTWAALILLYCFAASLTPVWALLQPRGYLGGFVLFMALAAGTTGLVFGGFEIHQPAFRGFLVDSPTGLLFPFLFVTIACGACSGFHGLVCSGTTSKQIDREPHCRLIGFGGMFEGFAALIALGTIMIATQTELTGKAPGAVYGYGLGRFLTVLIGERNLLFAVTFGAMAFSTFVFDTLDVSTRLGRYILQELLNLRGRSGAVVATAVTCLLPFCLILLSGPGAYRAFWTLFGTSNQLLAALSLLTVSVWLKRSGRRYAYALVPALFLLTVTLSALLLQARAAWAPGASLVTVINGVVALALTALAGALLVSSAPILLRPRAPSQAGLPPAG